MALAAATDEPPRSGGLRGENSDGPHDCAYFAQPRRSGNWSNAFRLLLQPGVATFFAIRDGLKDARECEPPYFWGLFTDKGEVF